MTDQPASAMASKRRQRIAIILAVAGLLIMTVGVAATDNPRHYIYLRLVAHPFVSTFVGLVMLAAGVPSLVTHERLRVAVLLVITLLLTLVGVARAAIADLPVGPATEIGTIAASDRFRLVAYDYPGLFSTEIIGLRVQSRAGLFSRESPHVVACFAAPRSLAGNEWLLDHASFADDNTIDITTQDGRHWTASFDPTTLEPIQVVDRCSDAPDMLGD